MPVPRARLPKRLLALRGDDALVARLQAGDEVAFEVLYDRYSAPLLSFCRHMLGRIDEAEDAVQQVFASAHADLQRNTREPQLKPWLYTIARNRCLSILRARRERPDDELEPVATAGLQEQVQQRAELRQLVADLGDLPENQRAALLLTELEDFSHAQAARVLECELGQVKGLVFRAREGLIERRDARGAPCAEIRAELSTARRGALRRGRLRHHLAQCPGCSTYLHEVRRQRKMMALILPVIPATGFKRTVLAAVGIGGGGGAGGATVVGGSILSGTAAKVATVAVLAGGAGVATEQAVERNRAPAADPAPAPARSAAPASATPMPAKDRRQAPPPGARALSNPGRKAKTPRGAGVTKGKSRSNRGVSPPGPTRRPANQPAVGRRTRPAIPPGQTREAPVQRQGSPARGAPAPSPRAGPKLRTTKPDNPKGLLKD